MVRKVLGVIGGYVVMAAFIFITFSITYLLLGTEGSFQSDSYKVSGIWILASMVLGFIGAVLGGLASIAIGKSRSASMILAGIVLILGVAMAIPTLSQPDEETLVRSGDVAMIDAMQKAHQPPWLALLNPIIGAIGVMIGSCAGKKKEGNSEV
jgi:cytochrome bd-type quinol oxidase subunit 2